MFDGRMRKIVLLAFVLMVWPSLSGAAETWKLGEDQSWKSLPQGDASDYASIVAKIKELVDSGQVKAARAWSERLKKEYPEVAGADFDSYIEAELLFGRGKFSKASKSYNKLMDNYRESSYYDAALDRQFSIGRAFLAGQKRPVLKIFKIRGYSAGEKIMDNIIDRAGDAPISKKAAIEVALSYEKRFKFTEAYQRWSEVGSRWSTGAVGKMASLGMGRCSHASYRGADYDYSGLLSAKSYYEDYQQKYPTDAERLKLVGKLSQIEEQKAYKQYSIGSYYAKTGSIGAANLYYQLVVDQWPKSSAATMASEAIRVGGTNSNKEQKGTNE